MLQLGYSPMQIHGALNSCRLVVHDSQRSCSKDDPQMVAQGESQPTEPPISFSDAETCQGSLPSGGVRSKIAEIVGAGS